MSYDRRDDRAPRGYDDRRTGGYGGASGGYGGGSYGSGGYGGGYGGGRGYESRGPPPAPRGRRLYVSGIGNSTNDDIDQLFGKYGRIVDVALKQGFCFIEYADERDAGDAVYGRDGYDYRGQRLRVEHCKPRGARDVQFGLAPPGAGGYDRPPPKCFNCGVEGHVARDCKEGDWSNRCYFCKEEGHKTPQCPAKAAQYSGGAAPSSSYGSSGARHQGGGSSSTSAGGDDRRRDRSRSPRRDRERSRSRSRSRGREQRAESTSERDTHQQDGAAAEVNQQAAAADETNPAPSTETNESA